ncbi:MAG: tetratricopeptide repeat protein [Fimbriimonas sp.]|nr:tetratricopeptide repeat protein [Fimbriimonas sp.]
MSTGIEALMQRGAWEDAIVECRAVLQLQPTNTRILGYLGMCHFRKGEFDKAIEPFRKASVLDPNFWEAGVKLAQCHDRLRRYEEAYEIAREWLRVRPQDHTLQGLVEALKYQVRGNRVDGWERTAHLAHNVKFARDR